MAEKFFCSSQVQLGRRLLLLRPLFRWTSCFELCKLRTDGLGGVMDSWGCFFYFVHCKICPASSLSFFAMQWLNWIICALSVALVTIPLKIWRVSDAQKVLPRCEYFFSCNKISCCQLKITLVAASSLGWQVKNPFSISFLTLATHLTGDCNLDKSWLIPYVHEKN